MERNRLGIAMGACLLLVVTGCGSGSIKVGYVRTTIALSEDLYAAASSDDPEARAAAAIACYTYDVAA